MAERNYNPFSGYSRNAEQRPSGGLGKSLQSVDWSQQQKKEGWVVFDAKSTADAATAKKEATKAPAGLPAEEAEEWRKTHSITVFGDDCPSPMPDFKMLTMLPPFIQKKFADRGFTAPTVIQAQSWPILFQNRDFVGIAKTGSGKTMAFIVPAIAHIAVQPQLRAGDGPIVVVLAPTRELAMQIEEETKKILPTTMRCACIYGGSPKGPQIQLLREGIHILVATPGRLIDMLEIKRTNLLRTTYVVLDEADRMLDMGFEPQVRSIFSQIRPDRQTLMFSATWPKEIQAMAASFQKDYIRINVGSTELLANPDVTQEFIHVSEDGKFVELRKLMAKHRDTRVLVFCKTKKTADFLERQLRNVGFDIMAIHGDKEQKQREYILDRFRRESKLTVVATDVAARGLDIKQLEVVINYDFPMQIDDYVHRIGRTGRAGAKGHSYTFISKAEDQITPAVLTQLLSIISKAGQEVPEFLTEWSNSRQKYSAVRRPRESFAARGAPPLRYNHGNAPSFDPASGQRANFLGQQQAPSAAATHFGGAAQQGNRAYTRFIDSDDEDNRPAKQHRAEQ